MYCSHKNSNTIWLLISSDTNEAHQPCTECTVVIGVETTLTNNKTIYTARNYQVGKTLIFNTTSAEIYHTTVN